MTDFGRALKFGYFLVPNAADPLLETAREVERLGLDYLAVQDHPYQRRFVDTLTLLSMVAATTSRVGVFPDVANLQLRPPAMLAKATASLDLLSGGRVELGLGAGGFPDAAAAFGGPRRGAPGPGRGHRGDPQGLERRAQPPLRGDALPPCRGTLRTGACPPDRHLARRLRAQVAAAHRQGGRRLGAVVPWRAAARPRHDGPAGRGRGRGGAR